MDFYFKYLIGWPELLLGEDNVSSRLAMFIYLAIFSIPLLFLMPIFMFYSLFIEDLI